MIRGLINMFMLASGLLGMLPGGRRAARKAALAGRPLHGVHYRLSEDTRGGRHGARIEALCPDGVWRAFLWVTNAENPWLRHEHHKYRSDAESARWLADKFVGPEFLPGGGEAMSEEGVRSSSAVGVWVLDPYDAEASRRAGYPFHGEGWPNHRTPLCPSGERLEGIRLLPCYETCRRAAAAGQGADDARHPLLLFVVVLILIVLVLIGGTAGGGCIGGSAG